MKTISLIIACFLSIGVHALENEITVLGVSLHGTNTAVAEEYLRYISAKWPTSTLTTIKLVNGGKTTPIVSVSSGTGLTQLHAAKTAVLNAGLRDLLAADVIMFFTGAITDACGVAEQHNWTNRGGTSPAFVPIDGLDKAGAEFGYASITSTTNPDCIAYPEVALHEFGHLFGAGHIDEPNAYLFAESHAWALPFDPWNPFAISRTIMAGPILGSTLLPSFSNAPVLDADNLTTLKTTALSVANYRTTTIPGCGLSKPVNLIGELVDSCLENGWTQHRIAWGDTCPTASLQYEVWKSQPIGQGKRTINI